jgi:hypothetical protein
LKLVPANLRNSVFLFLGVLLFGVFCLETQGTASEVLLGYEKSDYGEFSDEGGTIPIFHYQHSSCEEEENEDFDDSPIERAGREIFSFQRHAVAGQNLDCGSLQPAKRYLLYCCLKVDC